MALQEMSFTLEEKVELFDRIAERYYNHNFGTMLKADMDTLIFSAYIEHCLKNGLPYDDYTLSIQLGITENRVRSLKERKQLQYPYGQYKWKEAFVELIPKAKYNKDKKMVQLSIGDVNLIKDVRHFIYENGWYDEFQLNPKLFQCRLDFFIDLCSRLEETISISEESKSALKKLEANEIAQSAIKKIISGSFEDGIKDLIKSASKEVIIEVLKLLPFGGLASKAVESLITIMTKS